MFAENFCACTVIKLCPPLPAQDGSYTSEQLRSIFGRHGEVADVVLREPKKKKSTGSALVVMATPVGAAAAADAQNGDVDNGLLVVPFLKVRLLLLARLRVWIAEKV